MIPAWTPAKSALRLIPDQPELGSERLLCAKSRPMRLHDKMAAVDPRQTLATYTPMSEVGRKRSVFLGACKVRKPPLARR